MDTTPLFPVGSPVGSEDIIDREDYMRDLQTRLLDGKHLWVVGPRRIGKTSVIEEVLRRLRQQGLFVAAVDLFKVASLREFAEDYANACLENESGTRKTLRALQEMSGSLAPKVTYKVEQTELELALAMGRKNASDAQVLSQALDLAEEIARRRGRRMVVALDEFQDVGKLGGGDLLKSMRAHFQQHKRVSYIFLGSLQTWMRDIFSDRQNQPFYRFATEHPVPEIPRAPMVDYILCKFGQRGINIDDALAGIIVDHAGGHPVDTMQLCSELYYVLLQSKTTEPTPALVLAAYERCLTSLERVFGDEWQRLRANKNAQRVAKLVAKGLPPFGESGTSSQEVSKVLKHLIDLGVLQRERRGTYRFTEAMFAEYVRRL